MNKADQMLGGEDMYDIVLKNGSILDGSGSMAYVADVAIKDGKIAKIGKITEDAERVIELNGLTVTAGWIDSHSHSDRTHLTYPDQKEKVEQGITFSITGQCGGSPAPIQRNGALQTAGEYISEVKKVKQGSGSALLIGHNSIRRAVMNSEKRAPTAEEMQIMKDLLEDGMKNGAIGMSLGLYYVPGSYAEIDEVIELGKVVAKYNGIITSHIRSENDGLIDAVKEFIDIIRATGCRAVFSHHKAQDKCNWGKVKTTLEMIDKANAEGMDIYLDVYPYIASSTSMRSRFLPAMFHPEGTKSVVDLLDRPEVIAKAKAWGHGKWGNDLGWTLIVDCAGHPEYRGLNINEIADSKGYVDRFDAVFELLREGNGVCSICTFMMCEDDVEYIMKHPRAMMCTDAAVRVNDAPVHPRIRGAFPRVLGRYIRERKILPLPEMIRKMTALPAYVYGLTSKGKIAEGFDADICVFDPEKIIDRADYTNSSLPNEGLEYVLIDGKVVFENGKYNGIRAAELYTYFLL